MMKQTAVESLVEKLEIEAIMDYSFAQAHKVITLDIYTFNKLFEQANKIFEEQLKDAYNQGYRDGDHDASNIPLSIGDISEYTNAEKYYNQIYKSE